MNQPEENDNTADNSCASKGEEPIDLPNTSAGSSNKRNFLEVNNFEKYKQFMLKPIETKRLKSSDALAKVRDFLPLLKESTSKLLEDYKNNLNDLDIENVGDEEEHIEMNLAMVSDSDTDSDEDNEDDEEDEEEEEVNADGQNSDEDSTDESIDALQLGFKVKNSNRFKKLKISSEPVSKSKKRLIKILDEESPEENLNGSEEENPTSSSNIVQQQNDEENNQ